MQALGVAVAVGAARLGHDRVAASRLPFVRRVVGVKQARDRPEEFSQPRLPLQGRRLRLVEARRLFLRPAGLFVCPEQAGLGAADFALDLGQLGQPRADRLRVARLELAELLLQGRQLRAPPGEQRFEPLDFERGVGRRVRRSR